MSRVANWLVWAGVSVETLTGGTVWAQPATGADAAPATIAAEPSPLLKEPTTPEETFDALVLLVDLARFDLASGYLKSFVEGQPSDELLQKLRDEYGTATFVRLSRIPELKADAESLLLRLNDASRKQAEDPAYIDSLMTRLAESPLQRDLAIRELRNAGIRAVPQMLKRLGETKSEPERDLLVFALSRMGQQVVPAVIAGIDSTNDAIRTGCIEVVTILASEAAVPRLWPLAVGNDVDAGTKDAARHAIARIRFGNRDRVDRLSDSLAIQELRTRTLNLLTNTNADSQDDDNSDRVTFWTWDNAAQAVVPIELSREEYGLREATRAARQAFAISSDSPDSQTLYLLTQLASEVHRVGWDQVLSADTSPVMQIAVASGVEPLLTVLQTAMKLGRTDATWAALNGLSALAAPELMRGSSPVLTALNYPDPRVQFAAAIVILRSSSSSSTFPGAGRVIEILRRSLKDPAKMAAVIIDPDAAEAARLSTYVYERGYNGDLTPTGREGFTRATQLAGVQLVVVHANIANWGLTQTLANLRADARTAYLPIIVYGPDYVRKDTARLISRTGNAVFVGESPAAESFWLQAGDHLKHQVTPPISSQQRQDFKALSVFWLAQLLTKNLIGQTDLKGIGADLSPLIYDETVARNVLAALGQIGTADVQSRLAEFTLNAQLPLEIRRAAARELSSHIPRFGLFLSAGEVAAVTQGWQTADDVELQARLAAVVGSFKPATGLVGERLRQLP